ncbi:MAG: M48 family metalloprotease, partial [Nitrospinaceae bacterium]|nr:M48 family metalloprotease [Nitrospinaceae bacterium]NIR53937.1 M48 family metalloprotease [Nitrospinaceae bacterium]NIS84355.1 M48 family metalloprotease [Nitrospinaceae bacterium]NIT81158.1 M48 family metalloprotease [Nitrospinaceae bacterium]NIU43440.1 M48 family metalloprotease [Nitrospinaceae bacterium]
AAKEPTPEPQPTESQQEQQQAPQKEEKPGGLIGLGSSLGIFDEKTSDVLQKGVGTLKAFQPIGYEEERAIGGSLAVQVFNRFGGMYPNTDLHLYVNLVGQAVAQVSDRPDIPYHFAVVNSEHPNAFAAPGGYVFVSVGLLRLLENEAQLAGVLGHEIAHITQKHALQTLQRSKILKGVGNLTTALMDKNPAMFDQIIDQVSEVLFTRGLDKELEFEADKLGTEFAYRIGYFPGGLKNFLQILGKARGRESIFFSTHPSPGDRLRRLTQLMPRYQEASLFPVLKMRFRSITKGL